MRIYVDADACPVTRIVEQVAKEMNIPVTLLCDTNHVLASDYSEVKIIGAGADAVDFALVSMIRKGDVCVTQDYGVAAMALGKGALCMNQNGRQYTNGNIDELLMQRHLAKKARRSNSKAHLKGPAARTKANDEAFRTAFRKLLENAVYPDGRDKALAQRQMYDTPLGQVCMTAEEYQIYSEKLEEKMMWEELKKNEQTDETE